MANKTTHTDDLSHILNQLHKNCTLSRIYLVSLPNTVLYFHVNLELWLIALKKVW